MRVTADVVPRTRLGWQSLSQFIPNVLDGSEVRALSKPVRFLGTKVGEAFLYKARFVIAKRVSFVSCSSTSRNASIRGSQRIVSQA